MKLSIIIPVFNERETIEKIIRKVKSVEGIEKEIIIIDDASSDGTTEILKGFTDLKTIFKKKNEGKGSALRDGFKVATGDYVIVQDADLEYDPDDYIKLIDRSGGDGKSVVYGSRFSGVYKDMSSAHYIGNKFLTLVTNVLFDVKLTDMETCFKLIPLPLIKKIQIKSRRFNFEPEITAKILKSGINILEVPITYRGRSFNDGKKITWKDGISALWTLIKYRFVD